MIPTAADQPGDDIVEVVAVKEVVARMTTSHHQGDHGLVVGIGALQSQHGLYVYI